MDSRILLDQPQSIVVDLSSLHVFKFLLGDEEIVFTPRQMYILFSLLKDMEKEFERNHINV